MIRNNKINIINAGILKDTATLIQPTYTPNGRGGNTVDYTSFGVVWCSAIPVRDNRKLEQAAINYNQAYKFIIRVQNVSLTNDWRITFNGKTYTIHSIIDIDQRYQYWEILAYNNAI